MANRREILQAGLAVSALPATGLAAFTAPAAAAYGAPLALECFVCDQRFADSIAAARAAERHGFDVHATSGDMTELWYHRLDALWRRRAAAIAGVTGEDALFVLERLGWDRGLRVVYRGRHVLAADGDMRHRLVGAERLVERLAKPRAGAWPERFVRALARCGSDVGAQREARREMGETGRPDSRLALASSGLTSWLLAPTPAARTRG